MHRRTFGRRFLVPLVAATALLVGSAGAATAAPVEGSSTTRLAPPRLVYIVQQGTGRYLDAHEVADRDYNVVTRPFQNDTTQQWLMTDLGDNHYTFQQVSSGRYLDAHEDATKNYRAVTRPKQNNSSQAWHVFLDYGWWIYQVNTSRHIDTTTSSSDDYQVQTLPSGFAHDLWNIVDV